MSLNDLESYLNRHGLVIPSNRSHKSFLAVIDASKAAQAYMRSQSPRGSGYVSPVRRESGYVSPVRRESGYVSPVRRESGYVSPVRRESGYVSPVRRESGYVSPVRRESGYVSPVRRESGYVSPVRTATQSLRNIDSYRSGRVSPSMRY
jgi:hypothetical protein